MCASHWIETGESKITPLHIIIVKYIHFYALYALKQVKLFRNVCMKIMDIDK